MNILKEITVSGQLFPTHAKLTLQFAFQNPTSYLLSPRYFFPLPEGAAICGMQLFTKEKTLLRAEIAPLTEYGPVRDGFQLTQLDPCLYSLKWKALSPGESCTVLVECILHLRPQMGQCRLVLPFGIPLEPSSDAAPCPVMLDFALTGLEPARLSPEDSYDSQTGTLSCTAWTGKDFFLDFTVQTREACGLLQEEFGNGLGFARLTFPPEQLLWQPDKSKALLLLDLSHATTQRAGNALKELLFRIASALPKEMPVQFLSAAGQISDNLRGNDLYQALQVLPAGVGSLEELLHTAGFHQAEDTLTILVSDGAHSISQPPDLPLNLATIGSVRHSSLPRCLQGEHLHFYPTDSLEKVLPHQLRQLLCTAVPVDISPEGNATHDCLIFPRGNTFSDGYLDIAFSYSGRQPQGFSLWQEGKRHLTCPLLNTTVHSRLLDAQQLFAIAKIHKLTELLEKATPVSGRSIKQELAHIQTKFRILGSETILTIPVKGNRQGIPAYFYSAPTEGVSALADRPTIFGEGVRTLPREKREQLEKLCRKAIYDSIRSDGSIHSPLCITPQMSAEETAFSLLALAVDGKTPESIIQDAVTYLKSAPRTPWSFLLKGIPGKEQLQKELLPKLPDFETLWHPQRSHCLCSQRFIFFFGSPWHKKSHDVTVMAFLLISSHCRYESQSGTPPR